jgi:hypothetical protein
MGPPSAMSGSGRPGRSPKEDARRGVGVKLTSRAKERSRGETYTS